MQCRQLERKEKRRRKVVLLTVMAMVGCAGLCLLVLSIYGNHQMRKIPELSFQEALAYTTRDNADAVITVGTIQNGIASYTVYGENGEEQPQTLHTYEIGSITKTFTAAMVSQAVKEGRMELDATINQYLSLPAGNRYPTIEALLTHTSGYRGYYFASPMISNFFCGKNSFYGITKAMVKDRAGHVRIPNQGASFHYSNYGYAVLGLVLEAVYERDYAALICQFVQDLHLPDTLLSTQSGDLGEYWDWHHDDAYLAAGGLTSNMQDMLAYAQLQLDEAAFFYDTHKSLKKIDAATAQYRMMGINMDEIGMAWIIDREHHIIWHNGGTGHYNSYLGFDTNTGVAVVILSNLAPNDRIPATVLGVKLCRELQQQTACRPTQ